MYDLIIIGSGVAGMVASIYASRYGLKHLIFGREIGGLGLLASKVENYPGYTSITGPELMGNFQKQVEKYGVKIRQEEIVRVKREKGDKGDKREEIFEVISQGGESFKSYCLILAMGAVHRQLNIPGEKEFLGKGVSYCASCDGFFFRNKVVGVVGGGDSAAQAVVHLADISKKVYLIYRKGRREMRMERAWREKIEGLMGQGKVELVLERKVVKILGGQEFTKLKTQNSKLKPACAGRTTTKNSKLEKQFNNLAIQPFSQETPDRLVAVELDKPYNQSKHLLLDGLFVEIGQVPASALAADLGVNMDKDGYLIVDLNMQTNVPGVFAAGDLAIIPGQIILRQFVTAAAEGALAATSVHTYLKGKSG